jgi:hypothetical protein
MGGGGGGGKPRKNKKNQRAQEPRAAPRPAAVFSGALETGWSVRSIPMIFEEYHIPGELSRGGKITMYNEK